MPDSSAKSFVLRHGEVSTFSSLERWRDHISGRIALPVAGLLGELEKRLDGSELPPAGVVG
jgi:hypothetical protein